MMAFSNSAATPKQIRELMKADGLTNDEVKSHLQKYRLHARRPASAIQNDQREFVVVGGIWVPPPPAAAAVAIAGGTANRACAPAAARQDAGSEESGTSHRLKQLRLGSVHSANKHMI